MYLSQMFVPSGSQDSQNILASAGVDHQDETLVGLLHYDEVEVVPGDDPPLSISFTCLPTPQLVELFKMVT